MVVNKMIVHVLGKTYYAGHCETWPARGNAIKDIGDGKRSDVMRARARARAMRSVLRYAARYRNVLFISSVDSFGDRKRGFTFDEDFTLFFRCVSSRIVLIYGCCELAKASAPFSVTIDATAFAIRVVSSSLEYETNAVPASCRHHRGNNAENKPDVKERLYCTI